MDFSKVKELIELIKGTDVTEVEVESDGTRIKVARGTPGGTPVVFAAPGMGLPAQTPQTAAPAQDEGVRIITAEMVGVFYRAATPEAEPFVDEGSEVDKGGSLCIIEAMKMMNEILADFDCRILEVLAKNGEAVQYGTPLFKVEPR
ncbi:MAG: acetyl-CoA carboxylase biotin carboxyl carrier protein [Myxococcales bacterium]|nr:acetyl-CoA carboxylase biotin carboxyl carrier protein [Myxococcales bacterium]